MIEFLQSHQVDPIGVREQFSVAVLHCILAGRRKTDQQSIDDAITCVSGIDLETHLEA